MFIKTNSKLYRNRPERKQYFLCDSGYDSVEIDKTLRNDGYEPIILQNKRNIKDPAKIRKLTEKQKKIYKKRTVVENSYSWLKQYPKMNCMYEKRVCNFKGLALFAYSDILFGKLSTDIITKISKVL